jgi:class 3 adenylate cyclase
MGGKMTRVLLVEDDERTAKLVERWFEFAKESMLELEWADSLRSGLKRLEAGGTDAVLLDLGLSDSSGLETLVRVRRAAPQAPIVVLTSSEYDKVGIDAVKNGAQDFLHKGEVDSPKLVRAIFFAIERKRLENQKFQRVAEAAHKIMSPDLIKKVIAETGDNMNRIDQLLITILFADIRNFTTISERYPKELVIKLINYLLEEMAMSVTEEDGYIDKFLGDGLMALFGALKTTDNDWLRAVRAAYKMQARIEIFNRQRATVFPELTGHREDIRIGVGIHSGMATVGFIGTSDRYEYTAIGDCVNIASRLCSEAEGGEILITRVVADAIGDQGEVDDWRLFQLKGKALTTEAATLKYVKL